MKIQIFPLSKHGYIILTYKILDLSVLTFKVSRRKLVLNFFEKTFRETSILAQQGPVTLYEQGVYHKRLVLNCFTICQSRIIFEFAIFVKTDSLVFFWSFI